MPVRRIRWIYRITTTLVIFGLCWPNARVRYLASLIVLVGARPLFQLVCQDAMRYGAHEALTRYRQAHQAAAARTRSTDHIFVATAAGAR